MPAPGSLLQDRYRIERQIGSGGMGTVYEAIDERFDKVVAVKESSFKDNLEWEHAIKAFKREARLLHKLEHRGLPKVTDHFNEAGSYFLVMTYIPGETLLELLNDQLVRNNSPFELSKILTWADQLFDILGYLHCQKPPIIHRDIKPDNLKLTPEGQIILLDFGLAKGAVKGISEADTILQGGTAAYAAPEQMFDQGTSEVSDIFSLAATLYHLLTGEKPIPAKLRAGAIYDGRGDTYRPVEKLNANAPIVIANAINKALSYERGKRFQTIAEFRQALIAIQPDWQLLVENSETKIRPKTKKTDWIEEAILPAIEEKLSHQRSISIESAKESGRKSQDLEEFSVPPPPAPPPLRLPTLTVRHTPNIAKPDGSESKPDGAADFSQVEKNATATGDGLRYVEPINNLPRNYVAQPKGGGRKTASERVTRVGGVGRHTKSHRTDRATKSEPTFSLANWTANTDWAELLKDLAGLVLLVFGVVLLFSLVSYDKADPSINSIGPNVKVKNWIGPVGASISTQFLKAFGWFAWGFPLVILGAGWWLLRPRELPVPGVKLLGWLLTLVALVGLLALSDLGSPQNGDFHRSGWIGQLLVRDGLVSSLNQIGTFILLATLLLAGVLISTPFSLSWLPKLMDDLSPGGGPSWSDLLRDTFRHRYDEDVDDLPRRRRAVRPMLKDSAVARALATGKDKTQMVITGSGKRKPDLAPVIELTELEKDDWFAFEENEVGANELVVNRATREDARKRQDGIESGNGDGTKRIPLSLRGDQRPLPLKKRPESERAPWDDDEN